MFKISKERFGKAISIRVTNLETKESFSVLPEFGAKVHRITLAKDGRLFDILEGDSSYKELINNNLFRGSKLFPFPNRINKGRYMFNGETFNFKINFPSQGHAIHGLVYDKKFTLKSQKINKNSASITLEYNSRSLLGYPFPFLISLTFTLSKRGFEYKTFIKNTGIKDMPFGDGWHPYFSLGKKIDELFLKIPSSKEILVNKLGIPYGGKKKFSSFSKLTKIGKKNFDTGFFLVSKERSTETILFDSLRKIKLTLRQQTGKNRYNYLQIFTPKNRSSIAIEPMTCSPDSFNNKDGLIILRPEKSFEARCMIQLS